MWKSTASVEQHAKLCAFTAVAPIVRFNALEIFATGVRFLASDFNSFTSDDDHARRVTFFLIGNFLAGISISYFPIASLTHQWFSSAIGSNTKFLYGSNLTKWLMAV